MFFSRKSRRVSFLCIKKNIDYKPFTINAEWIVFIYLVKYHCYHLDLLHDMDCVHLSVKVIICNRY